MNAPAVSPADSRLHFYQPQGSEVELFLHASRNQLPVLIKGPTGCGKTRFIEHMAEQLKRPLYTVACHDDLTAADLIGRYLIGNDGTFWQDGPLTRAVREGAICYLDEVIEARKDTTVVIHPLTDDRRILPLDGTGEQLHAAPGFMLVMSYNPGYRNLMKGLKPSTRQRFVSIGFNYPDEQQEARIVMQESGIDLQTAQRLCAVAAALRKLNDADLEESPSTRLLIHCARLIRSGLPAEIATEAALTETLSDEPAAQQAVRQIIRALMPVGE
ncbi:CbbQ/NirQ/NorQ/GpvN family protein [Thalassolituus sp. ST750PaO-4]|jgi:nitric oxide reductase NorQ protein|uniref:CbbQ/NirQ/NorQ/GpvN family protein n=1 Tax=Thalassolituus hydrocarboniclasticus TaxID=2742796 RepID=A0ABY6AE36_9GAMM|nr:MULTISPECIES: CbbQ/NirQ/NorQ/GpvN family protein [Thalassolituus]MCA6058635.1 CbbQ/NirQ/NorQ/GpvN family protein [Thalassolituus sp. ST750PaO-4]UXD88912.1 CbbQ/NirQ/NorQ/GpvN family protein [Thalassolituus hydrocarboniclasticus]